LASEPQWLAAADIVALNAEIVAATGEPHAVRDANLLESACAKPINHWHYGEEEMAVLAVALLLGIARNHPFAQGNKRTAFEAADAFLFLNGYDLEVADGSDFADLIVEVITGAAPERELVELFQRHLRGT
jgi:death-on-curing protein